MIIPHNVEGKHGLTLTIEHDPDPTSPREWDCLGRIVYLKSSSYVLGDEAVDRETMDDIGAKIDSGELIGLSVYAYVHSGVAVNTSGFHCPWDSGQSGWISCTQEKAKEWLGERFSHERTLEALRQEIETYNSYLQGSVYGYSVEDSDENVLDSCWGFVGDLDYCLEEGKRVLAHFEEEFSDEQDRADYSEITRGCD